METTADSLKGYKILVAEDDRDIQAFMKKCLEYCGACVKTASNGLDALDSLSHERFDVALLDIEMPKCSGLEVATRVRQCGSHLPIVAISSLANQTDMISALDEKFDERLEKPVRLPALIEVIKHLKSKPEVEEVLH